MTPIGPRSKTGHMYRDGKAGPTFCGRIPTGKKGRPFSDPSTEPPVCKICLRGWYRQVKPHHHHIGFQDGKWSVFGVVSQGLYTSGGVNDVSYQCHWAGCDVMVPQKIMPDCTTTNCGVRVTWAWTWAA